MDADRRRRFKVWFERQYGHTAELRKKFLADSGQRGEEALTKGRLNHYLKEGEAFGERAARQLAQRFGLPLDYFEHDEVTFPSGVRVVMDANVLDREASWMSAIDVLLREFGQRDEPTRAKAAAAIASMVKSPGKAKTLKNVLQVLLVSPDLIAEIDDLSVESNGSPSARATRRPSGKQTRRA